MKFFKKKHLIFIKKTEKKYINKVYCGNFGIYFLESGIINSLQFKSIFFFLKKRLKIYSKLFIRISKNLKKTKKSIGVRMGKGKGSIDDYYIPVKKGQILVEFIFKNLEKFEEDPDFLFKIKKIIFLFSLKLNIKVNFIKLLH